jgi:hypothetical protein
MQLQMPPVQTFGAPAMVEVVRENPYLYHVEVFSDHFVQQLFLEENGDPRQAECAFVTYTLNAKPRAASKCGIC